MQKKEKEKQEKIKETTEVMLLAIATTSIKATQGTTIPVAL